MDHTNILLPIINIIIENSISLNIPPCSFLLPAVTAEHGTTWSGTSLRSGGVSCPVLAVSPLKLCAPSHPHWHGREKQKRPWCCVRTTQQYLKHQCFINNVLITNPNHGTLQVATKKINSIPVHTRTAQKYFLWKCGLRVLKKFLSHLSNLNYKKKGFSVLLYMVSPTLQILC